MNQKKITSTYKLPIQDYNLIFPLNNKLIVKITIKEVQVFQRSKLETMALFIPWDKNLVNLPIWIGIIKIYKQIKNIIKHMKHKHAN